MWPVPAPDSCRSDVLLQVTAVDVSDMRPGVLNGEAQLPPGPWYGSLVTNRY